MLPFLQSEKEDLYPEETQKMKNFINDLKIQDYCFTKEISNDRVYELLKKYMKKELIQFFESNKSKAIEELSNKIKEKNIEYDFNEFVSQVINIEGANEIYMSKIYDEINEISKNKKLFEINCFTVMLIGKSGVGKSTLINSLLQLTEDRKAKTGVGNFQTVEIKEYQSENVPFLRLVDTRGIEINKNFGVNQIQAEAEDYIKKQYNSNNINNFVQCIWYCISGNRFEDAEIELLLNLRKTYYNNKIPIIIVYTQASDDEMIEQMNKYIKDKNIDIKFINILAQRKKFHGKYVEAFGLKELIRETLHKCKRALKGDINFPSNFPASAKSILKHLLERDISKRYGCLTRGVNDIKQHRFYKELDWNAISKHRGKPPYIPPVANSEDLSLLNIINEDEEEAKVVDPGEDPFSNWIKKNK